MSDDSTRRATRQERLQEFYGRLQSTPRKPTAEEALREVCDVLEQVEDELSGVSKPDKIPPPSVSDGRMYCPLEDHVLRMSNGDILALTRGHRMHFSANGAVRILNKVTGKVEFEK